MKRAISIAAALLIMLATAATTYFLYNNHAGELEFDDIESKNKTVDSNGVFTGKFMTDKQGWKLCGFEYEIEEDDLYITMLGTPGDREPLPTDEEGYATVTIETGMESIDKVYYIYGDDKVSLSITRK